MTNDEIEALEKRLREEQSYCQDMAYTLQNALQDEAADAIAHLRAKVERLTRERDEEIRQKWIAVDDGEAMRKQCIFDRDAAIRRAETAERERDTMAQEAADLCTKYCNERDAAESQVATLREALRPFAGLHATRYMTNGCRYEFRVDAAWIRNAVTALAALAETGKKDEH